MPPQARESGENKVTSLYRKIERRQRFRHDERKSGIDIGRKAITEGGRERGSDESEEDKGKKEEEKEGKSKWRRIILWRLKFRFARSLSTTLVEVVLDLLQSLRILFSVDLNWTLHSFLVILEIKRQKFQPPWWALNTRLLRLHFHLNSNIQRIIWSVNVHQDNYLVLPQFVKLSSRYRYPFTTVWTTRLAQIVAEIKPWFKFNPRGSDGYGVSGLIFLASVYNGRLLVLSLAASSSG